MKYSSCPSDPKNKQKRQFYDQNTAPTRQRGQSSASSRTANAQAYSGRPMPGGASTSCTRPQDGKRPTSQAATVRPAPPKVPQQGSGTASRSGSYARAQTRRKKNRKKSRYGVIIAIILVLAILLGLYSLYTVYSGRIDGERTQAGVLPSEVKTPPKYDGPGVIRILLCGIGYDNDTADGYTTPEKIGPTDMIFYLVFDTENNKINGMQIPRDIYVGPTVETGQSSGFQTYKINNLFPKSPDPENRMAALTKVLYDQYGLTTDYYITIDLDAVREIMEIITTTSGGLPMYVPLDVVDDKDHNNVIPQGERIITAQEAEFLLRNRKSPTYNDQGDIVRLQVQLYFYSALFRQFKQLSPTDLVMWMNVLTYRCKTDMNLLQLGGLAQSALRVEGKDITFIRPACGGLDYNGQFVFSFIPDELARVLNEYFRPADKPLSVSQLNIQYFPENRLEYGILETSIRTMAGLQEEEEQVLS